MPAKTVRKGGKKGRKIGRNKVKCDRYRAEGRREKNKARRAESWKRKLAAAAVAALFLGCSYTTAPESGYERPPILEADTTGWVKY